ncbi:hypothetical protein PRUB_a1414 [Pseudoalteromonas rubra]|uniref:Uncharacterized protein n=1 Tax=Pseudoalteromonas rubra TaxID=43658 RepID=A0A8T0C7V7_9GAMM|nr:hypothetical protein PRUB_a1414 [Pseudoalteromonas rubra]
MNFFLFVNEQPLYHARYQSQWLTPENYYPPTILPITVTKSQPPTFVHTQSPEYPCRANFTRFTNGTTVKKVQTKQ